MKQGYWIDKSGNYIEIEKMTDKHLQNAVKQSFLFSFDKKKGTYLVNLRAAYLIRELYDRGVVIPEEAVKALRDKKVQWFVEDLQILKDIV